MSAVKQKSKFWNSRHLEIFEKCYAYIADISDEFLSDTSVTVAYSVSCDIRYTDTAYDAVWCVMATVTVISINKKSVMYEVLL